MVIISRRAFTLVETMIVLVIIAIILAVASHNYLKSGKTSQKTACIAHLERINSAIDQRVLENHTVPGTALSELREGVCEISI